MQKKEPDTNEATSEDARTPEGRKRRGLGFAGFFSLLVAGLVFFVLALALSGRTLPVPDFLQSRIEDNLNERLPGAPVRLGQMEFGIDRRGVPQLLVNDLQVTDQMGGAAVQLNWLGAELSPEHLVRGEVAAKALYLTGAQITLRRTAAGRLTVAANGGTSGGEQSLAGLLSALDSALSEGPLGALEQVTAGGIVLTLEDARSGRIWQATNARATMRKSNEALSLSIASDVFNGSDNLANLQLSAARNRMTEHVTFGLTLKDIAAEDIALQSPVLAWLRVLDAPISGSVRTELDETGVMRSFAGTLDIQEGALQPGETVPPVAFQSAKAYFTFDPARQRIDFSEVSVTAEDGRAVASGHSYLTDFDGLWPRAYVGQFEIDDASYAGGSDFDGPLALGQITADLRVRLDPFVVDLGQLAIDNDGAPISATGRVTADDTGWHVAIDATTPEISGDQVLQYWPKKVSPITRGWLSDNLKTGQLLRPALGLRYNSGAEPDVALSFEFSDGTARFLPNMPELEQAKGRAELHNKRFALGLTEGRISARDGTPIDAAGSQFSVPDTRPKPSWGEIGLVAAGPLEAVLDILNNPPLRLMERAGRPVDLAQADTVTRADVTLPLKDGIDADEVGYAVSAELRNVVSDQLVPGRKFTSPRLQLEATSDAISMAGPVQLDGVPLTANWVQPLGDAAEEGSQIRGRVSLSSRAVEAFDLPLPPGFLRGGGQADYVLSLPADPDTPPVLDLRSDLRGMTLALAALGWQKPASEAGALNLTATLGDVPEIEELSFETAGLSFEGDLNLTPGGALQSARFAALSLGGWLNADVDVAPSPNGGPPEITVSGGTVDLRRLNLGARGAGDESGPINLRLDRLTVSNGIALAPLVGRITSGPRGMSGTFQARLNGRTPVSGTLTPANAGTAVRITASDAAGVLRDAGLTPNGRRGSLDLILTPVVGAASGTFDGQFLIEDFYLKDAPVMAELLDAVSVVGLIDELGGAGIRFETIDGQFRLDRRQLRLQQAAAVGPSMGISADGVYDLLNDRMDFQGVVSPVYFLNGIGSILTRRGEGLFGFNYRMAGSAGDPSVGVNPLSILTPGAFRQIFRTAPPGG